MEITLPYNFQPRSYQLPLLRAIDNGIKRAVIVWPRRSGKDLTIVSLLSKRMIERVGSYYYLFPKYKQGRRIIWEGMDRDGVTFLSRFPRELLDGKPNDTEMRLKYKNGSILRVVGTDEIDWVFIFVILQN